MTSSEQFQQEIIDWINSDEAKKEFYRSQNFSVTAFPEALRHLYDYFDSKDGYVNPDGEQDENFVVLNSGICRRVEEKEANSHLIVILSLSSSENPQQFFQITSKLIENRDTYWKGADVKEVYAKQVMVTHYVDEPV